MILSALTQMHKHACTHKHTQVGELGLGSVSSLHYCSSLFAKLLGETDSHDILNPELCV